MICVAFYEVIWINPFTTSDRYICRETFHNMKSSLLLSTRDLIEYSLMSAHGSECSHLCRRTGSRVYRWKIDFWHDLVGKELKVEVTPNVTKPIFLEFVNVPGTSEYTYPKLGLLMYEERLNRGSVVGEGVSTEVVMWHIMEWVCQVMWYVTVMWCGLPKLCDFLSTSTTVTNLTHSLLRWPLIPSLRLGLCSKKWTIVPLSTAAEKSHRFCNGLHSKLWTALDQRLQSMVFHDSGSKFNLQQNGHHLNAPFMLITMVQVPALYVIPSQRYLA